MAGIVLVPMFASALRIDNHQRVVPASVDFARFPWSDGRHDHNADHPYLSLSVLNPPFASDNFTLYPGTHIHWMLPAVFRRGFLDQMQREHIYSPVPNFWMVRRMQGRTDETWVVESDVLLQPTHFQYASGSIMPYTEKPGTPPYRMIGRMMPFERWREKNHDPLRYPNLTARGYGDGTFASYYPACSRCFGYHDADHADKETTYEVLGWRREPGQGLLHWLTTATHLGSQHTLGALFDDALFDGQAGKERKTALGWKLIPERGQDASFQPAVDDTVVCYTRITVAGAQPRKPNDNAPSTISIGNNASNALTAYLVEALLQNQSSELTRHQLEEQLDHLAVDDALLGSKSDKYFKFLTQRHQDTFAGVPGGIRWSLRNEPHRETADANRSSKRAAHTRPQKFGTQLEEINRLQACHDQATYLLKDLKEQLFAEWHHYQLAMYPANLHNGIHQNADEIRHYMEHKTLPRIEQLQREVDRLAFTFANDQTLARVEVKDLPVDHGSDDHTVKGLSEALNALLNELALYNQSLISGRLHGNVSVGEEQAVGGYLQFSGGEDYVQLDHVDGLDSAILHSDKPLGEITVAFHIKVDAGQGGVVLSFDPKAWFEIEVPQNGRNAGKLIITTADFHGAVHRVESATAVATGQWEQVVICFGQGKISIRIGNKVETSDGVLMIGRGGARRGYLGASATATPFTETQEVHPGFKGALTGLRMIIGSIEKTRLTALMDPTDRPQFALRPTAATRYWQPREPAVAVVGNDAENSDSRLTEHQYPHDPLRCIYLERFPTQLFDIDRPSADRGQLQVAFRELMAIVDIAQKDPNSFGFNYSTGDSWRPLLSEWEVGLYPLAINDLHNGSSTHYAPNFIEQAYALERDAVDLGLLPAGRPLARTESLLTGRTMINPNHGHALHDRLQAFIESHEGSVPAEFTHAQQQLDSDRNRTLTFPLEGFVAAMRQKQQILQLPVDDPLAFDDYQPFAERVRRAVGDARMLSPNPVFHFNPIQSGAMELRRLRLIDNFGQDREQAVDNVRRVSSLRADDHSNLITLPVRLNQPARLDFRWLRAAGITAGGSEQESMPPDASEHAGSPICGWLTVNDLDGEIAVHDATGHPLGALTPHSDLLWRPLPGMEQAVAPAMFSNPTLGRVVEWLLRQGGTLIDLFARVIDHSLDNIHPENFGADEWALMSRRPLAVVRVKLALRLKGLPAVDQSFGALYQTLVTGGYHNADFDAVRFPVRLGDHRQVNDGLVGYWLQDPAAGFDGGFHAPNAGAMRVAKQAAGLTDKSDLPMTGDSEPPLIPLSINRPELVLTLLLDPRGHLQATSGVLPAKALTLPDNFYSDALAQMRPTFFTAPVLTPSDKLTLPLPRHNGLHWDWLERRREVWRRINQAAIGEPATVASASGPQEIREGWLELNSRIA